MPGFPVDGHIYIYIYLFIYQCCYDYTSNVITTIAHYIASKSVAITITIIN